MRLDLFDLIQILFLFVCISSIFSYILYSYKKYKKQINLDICTTINTKTVKYLQNIHIEDYLSFEKYHIWRFCVHFKNNVALQN